MKRGSIIALSALGAILLVLAFLQTPLMGQARATAWDTWITAMAFTFGISDMPAEKKISDRLEELVAENARLRAALADEDRLRHQLKTPTIDHLRPVPAAIVGRPVETLGSELILSKGITDGIAINDPVVVFGSTLIGFISEVQSGSAKVKTIYHPTNYSTVEVLVPDEDTPPARGLLTSRLYSALLLTTVPRDVPIDVGQRVVTVTDESSTPPGLFIGTIRSIESKEHDAYQEARLHVHYDIDTLDAVMVLAQP
jgi:cell shape-determining protein MreC